MLKTIVSPIHPAVKSTVFRGSASTVRAPFVSIGGPRPRPAVKPTIFDSYPTGDYEYVAAVRAAKAEGK